ncbi:hypothetical protein JL193_03845 [Polaribacter batillariae]|uniref:Uncharacterized protein n=1 Tax=Polaribacter batillariae TaxID=2808900 RepID=A0ABX7SY70_9FLAO|nr:hypothetical protein [Polaribacter batillariae]QTD38438.1 hypothetical protein JL193_03845 [Polaribacter batillariae]
MKFTKLKHNILQKKFDKTLQQSIENRIFSKKKIQSVAILTTEEISSKLDVLSIIEKTLEVRNAKIYSFRPYNKLNKFSYKHFSENDINWKGEFFQENFNSFLEQPFDLLIGYFTKPNLYLESAVLQSKASFKVGFSNINSNLFEIEISEDVLNIGKFTLELKKYLQIIKKL